MTESELSMKTLLGIFAKQPIPGTVKTRLARDLGTRQATRLYEAFLTDMTATMRSTGDERILCYAPDDADARRYFSQLAGEDYRLHPQQSGNLGDRLDAFFTHALQGGPRKVVVIGSDSPTLPTSLVLRAFAELDRRDAVIGASDDGGYYLLGLRRLSSGLFDGIDWSTSRVYDQQLERLAERGFTRTKLVPIPDIDTMDDLRRLASHPPPSTCHQTRQVLQDLNLP